MTTTHPSANDSGLNLDHLEALARAATAGPWLHRRDPGNPIGAQHCVKLAGEQGAWVCDCIDNADRSTIGGIAGERNAGFIAAANPSAVLELIALARRAALANQPAPTVSVPPWEVSFRKTYPNYAIADISPINQISWMKAEIDAYRAAHQPAQEQAEPDLWVQYIDGVKTQNVARDAEEKATVERIHRIMAPGTAMTWRAFFAAQQEPAAAPQQPESRKEVDAVADFDAWMAKRGPLGAGSHPSRAFIAGHAYGVRAAQLDGGQEGSGS